MKTLIALLLLLPMFGCAAEAYRYDPSGTVVVIYEHDRRHHERERHEQREHHEHHEGHRR